MTEDELNEQVFYLTTDPLHNHRDGKPLPAATVLLYKVCDNDQAKFDEACRLVNLFIAKAAELSVGDKHA